VRGVHTRVLLFLVLASLLAIPAWAADEHKKHPGYVDGSLLLSLADDDTGSVEVTLHGPLLQALMSFDPELKELAGELKSIHAVVLDLDEGDTGSWKKGRDLLLKTEKDLLSRGWSRITKIQDEGSNVSVLVLSDEETIGGLVVLVSDEGGELVFANIAGNIDLAAISKLGEKLDIPGLDDLDDE
jgi:hypothetical protein